MNDIEKRARELLAGCLDEWGHPCEAENVRDGSDLESYETELRVVTQLLNFGMDTGDGWAEQHHRDSQELRNLCASRDFYKHRCEALQAIQSNMRDPERKAVCDILANGSTPLLAARLEVGHE